MAAREVSRLDGVLRDLVTERAFSSMTFEDALAFLCNTLSTELGTARAGVWKLNDEKDAISLIVQWSRNTGTREGGAILGTDDAKSYLDAIASNYVLEITDAMTDPRCAELAQDYLPKFNVGAMLDCPIRTFGGLAGVVCIEHVGGLREWTREEVDFAVAVTSLVSLTMEHRERIAAEKTAAETENRLRVYTELANDWYWHTDGDFTFTDIAGPPAPHDAREPEQFVGYKLWEIPGLEPLEGTWGDLMEQVKARKRIADFVISAKKPEGTPAYVELTGIPKYEADGRFTGYWGTARDVSDRVRRNLDLARLYDEKNSLLDQLELIFDTCGIGSYRYDGQSRKLRYDESFLKLYGFDKDFSSEPGQFTEAKVHPDDRDEMKAFIRKAMFGEDTQGSHLFRAYRADGELNHIRTFWKQESEDPAGVKNIVGLHMDVTDIVTAQQESAKSMETIAAIAENLPGVLSESLWAKGAVPLELLYISPKCVKLWGYTQEDLIADHRLINGMREPEDARATIAAIDVSMQTAEPQLIRTRMTARDGTVRWIDYRVQARKQPDGLYRIFGMYVDVTNEVLAQQEAEKQAELAHRAQKNESIGHLTGGVAHDFNNILAVIMGNLELLREDVDNPDHHEMIASGIEASRRGADLTRSLLAFARKTRLQPKVVDLNDVARQAQNWMRRALPESIEVETSLLAGLWPTRLDAATIESALLNLILNARDAMAGWGKLSVVRVFGTEGSLN